MSKRTDKNRICKRLTKQDIPCRNKSVANSDYCFTHSVMQKRTCAYYLGVIGSVASIIGLIIFFFPSPQSQLSKANSNNSIPFFMSSQNNGFFSIVGSFEGQFKVLPESVEIVVNKAHINSSRQHPILKSNNITAITAGLGIQNKYKEWTISYRSQRLPMNKIISPEGFLVLDNLNFSIPKNKSTDISRNYLVIELEITNSDNSVGYTYVHSDEDIFINQ